MNAVTVAFYCSEPVIGLVTVSGEVHFVDGKRLHPATVKGDELTLTARFTASQVQVTLKNNTESGAFLLLVEDAILKR